MWRLSSSNDLTRGFSPGLLRKPLRWLKTCKLQFYWSWNRPQAPCSAPWQVDRIDGNDRGDMYI